MPDMNQPAPSERKRQKKNGIHYTPISLADFLAEQAWNALEDAGERRLTVIDPACGEGELLAAVCRKRPATRTNALDLIGWETDPVAVSTAESKFPQSSSHRLTINHGDFVQALTEQNDHPIFSANTLGPFADLIIANPPFVRTQHMGANLSQGLARSLGLRGRIDLYQVFAILSIGLLRPGGILAIILPNRFMMTQSAREFRIQLLKELEIEAIWDLGDTKLFEAAVLPSVMIGRRKTRDSNQSPSKALLTRIYATASPQGPAYSGTATILDAVRSAPDGIVQISDEYFNLQRGPLATTNGNHGCWSFEKKATKVVSAGLRIADVADMRVGIKTTADAVFIRDDWRTLPEEFRPESHLLRQLLTHDACKRWSISASDLRYQVLYTHESIEEKRRVIDLMQWPRAKAYLESHRERLSGRSYIAAAKRSWFEIWVPQQPHHWKRERLVCPDISERPTFALDKTGSIVNGDCYWIMLQQGVPEDYLYLILAIANSSWAVSFYDSTFSNRLYSGKRRYITQYVGQFPLPDLETETSRTIISLVRAGAPAGDLLLEWEREIDALVEQSFR